MSAIDRVKHVLIGKDIARTAGLTLGTATTSSNLAEGEVVVLDKNGALLAGQTFADTDTIFIGVGTDKTWTEVNGYTRRDIKMSPPIKGEYVKVFKGTSYSAPVQRYLRIGGNTGVVGREYILRAIYKDPQVSEMTPAQFTEEWRYIAKVATKLNVLTGLKAAINADVNARIIASTAGTGGASALYLYGKTITETTTQIDEHFHVDFDAVMYQALQLTGTVSEISNLSITKNTSTGLYTGLNAAGKYSEGSGMWQQVRDAEKEAMGYDGILNRTQFPVPSAVNTPYVVSGKTYDEVVIEYTNKITTSDMGYLKEVPHTLQLFIPVDAGQEGSVINDLNTWMSSLPNPQAVVAV